MKTFTAQVRVAGRRHGHGVGRSKKEAEQQAAEAAYRTLQRGAARHRPRRPRREAAAEQAEAVVTGTGERSADAT